MTFKLVYTVISGPAAKLSSAGYTLQGTVWQEIADRIVTLKGQ